MPFPSKVTGAGNRNARNVFKITFSEALAAAPQIEAWDNSKIYPERDILGSTYAKRIFTGTAGNGLKPMLYAVFTKDAAPGADWKPEDATVGGANPNRLKGTVSYCQSPSIPSGGYTTFNLGAEFPYDMDVPSSDHTNFVLQVRYRYVGDAPTVKIYANTGTEATPAWLEVVAGTYGLKFGDLNTLWSGTPSVNLPESGTVDAEEVGVTAA